MIWGWEIGARYTCERLFVRPWYADQEYTTVEVFEGVISKLLAKSIFELCLCEWFMLDAWVIC